MPSQSEEQSNRKVRRTQQVRRTFPFVDDRQQAASFYKVFGQKLRAARQQAHMSQMELAQAASIDRSYLAQIEKGRRQPSLHFAFRLAQALGVSLQDLLSSNE